MLEQVAFDLETTGFQVGDEITVAGFALPMGCRVFVQTGGRDGSGVESAVQDATPVHVQVSTHGSERVLLEAMNAFVADRLCGDDVLLIAFNGERWRGGFDLPFLRSRLAVLDLEWPFGELAYADVMPVIEHRFNTTVGADDEEPTDLVGVYDLLCDEGYSDLDPFAESAEAVDAYVDGEFSVLVRHNVADILRTRALGRLAERYCSKSEFQVKSLTPTREG
jgi:DNA polymerase III epsilon subunit-like protein